MVDPASSHERKSASGHRAACQTARAAEEFAFFLISRSGCPSSSSRLRACLQVMENFCAVCAEPLEWVSYGPCGHKEACSKCSARLRFVLNDKRCVICQVEHEAVFTTRSLGDFTDTLSPERFQQLKVRACCCPSIGQLFARPSRSGEGQDIASAPTVLQPTECCLVQADRDAHRVWYLPAAQIYFDDEPHYRDIR